MYLFSKKPFLTFLGLFCAYSLSAVVMAQEPTTPEGHSLDSSKIFVCTEAPLNNDNSYFWLIHRTSDPQNVMSLYSNNGPVTQFALGETALSHPVDIPPKNSVTNPLWNAQGTGYAFPATSGSTVVEIDYYPQHGPYGYEAHIRIMANSVRELACAEIPGASKILHKNNGIAALAYAFSILEHSDAATADSAQTQCSYFQRTLNGPLKTTDGWLGDKLNDINAHAFAAAMDCTHNSVAYVGDLAVDLFKSEIDCSSGDSQRLHVCMHNPKKSTRAEPEAIPSTRRNDFL